MHKRKHAADSDDDAQGANKALKSGPSNATGSRTRPGLRIITDIEADTSSPTLDALLSASGSEADSLFDEPPPKSTTAERETPSTTPEVEPSAGASCEPFTDPSLLLVRRSAPPIPGLFFDPNLLLPDARCEELLLDCTRAFFTDTVADQVMLFERAPSSSDASANPTGLPPFLTALLDEVSTLLQPVIPAATHALLFSPNPPADVYAGPARARQAIVNAYAPGEGIASHVDLLDRYGDGIVGVSFGSGCAMRFAPVDNSSQGSVGKGEGVQEQEPCEVYLPRGGILVMTGDARYAWTHGIEGRFEDLVEDVLGSGASTLIERGFRVSVTFRWLLPGADVVGHTSLLEDDDKVALP